MIALTSASRNLSQGAWCGSFSQRIVFVGINLSGVSLMDEPRSITLVFPPWSFLRAGRPTEEYFPNASKVKYTSISHQRASSRQMKQLGKKQVEKETPGGTRALKSSHIYQGC